MKQPHITPLWVYLAVGGALFVLTGITVGAAHINFNQIFGMDGLNFFVAMLIATFKATLVALFFMHLYHDNKFFLFTLLAGVLCLVIFIVLTLFDTQWRGHLHPEEKSPINQSLPSEAR